MPSRFSVASKSPSTWSRYSTRAKYATRRHAERNEGKYSQPDTSQEQISQGGKDYYPVV